MFKVSVVAYSQPALRTKLDHAWNQANTLMRGVDETTVDKRHHVGPLTHETTQQILAMPYVISQKVASVDELLREKSGYNGLRDQGWIGDAVLVVYVHPMHMDRLYAVVNCEIVAMDDAKLLDTVELRLVLSPTDGTRDIAWQGANSLICARMGWV